MFCSWRRPRFWFDLEKLEVKKWGWPTKCFFWPMKANHTALATGADLVDFLAGHQGWPQIGFCWSCCDFTRFFFHSAISRDFPMKLFFFRFWFCIITSINSSQISWSYRRDFTKFFYSSSRLFFFQWFNIFFEFYWI